MAEDGNKTSAGAAPNADASGNGTAARGEVTPDANAASGSETVPLAADKTAPLEPVGGVDAGAGADAAGVDASAASADDTGTTTGGAGVGAAEAGAVDTATASAAVTQAIDVDLSDPVVAKRIAHGLSPEPTDAKSGDLRAGGARTAASDGEAPVRRAFSKERREQKEAEDRLKKLQHKKRMRTLRRVILVFVLLLIVAAAIVFSWVRWCAVDDAAALQGQWVIAGSDATVTITDTEIRLTDDVAYDYVIDTEAKTIAYTFGGLTGHGRYRLALDGNSLAINDGDYDWFSTLVGDIPWTVEALVAELKHDPSKSPGLGAGQLLERVEQGVPQGIAQDAPAQDAATQDASPDATQDAPQGVSE